MHFYDFFKEFDERFQLLFEQKKELEQHRSKTGRFIKSAEVIRLLNICPSTLYLKRVNGDIPFTKIGNSILYNEKDILEILNKNKRMES